MDEKNKKYRVTIAFKTIEKFVTAKNRREAYKKAKEQLKKKSADTMVDFKNTYVDEWYWA